MERHCTSQTSEFAVVCTHILIIGRGHRKKYSFCYNRVMLEGNMSWFAVSLWKTFMICCKSKIFYYLFRKLLPSFTDASSFHRLYRCWKHLKSMQLLHRNCIATRKQENMKTVFHVSVSWHWMCGNGLSLC